MIAPFLIKKKENQLLIMLN